MRRTVIGTIQLISFLGVGKTKNKRASCGKMVLQWKHRDRDRKLFIILKSVYKNDRRIIIRSSGVV